MSDGVVIVGAGECGVRAAFALRQAGFEGAVTLLGEEPHLPYERPPLSKSAPPTVRPIATAEAYGAAGIDLVRGCRVTGIDRSRRRVLLADGGDLAYDKLLLATGARARTLPGAEAARTLRTLDDAEAIMTAIGGGRRLVIVGGGFIGLELAATARGLGAEVTVVEAAERLMARAVPAPIAAVAEARHRDAGVALILGTAVRDVAAHRVTLHDGHVLEGDAVIVGIGAVPNDALAAAAGLAVRDGVLVDGRLGTADPDIFAAGDCCRFPYRNGMVRLESWRAAQDQGAHAAETILGRGEPYARVPWFWSDQYELTLQVAGLPDPHRPFVSRQLDETNRIVFQMGEDGALICASGIGRGGAIGRDVRLAEMMIERGVRADPAQLADPQVRLKALLRDAGTAPAA